MDTSFFLITQILFLLLPFACIGLITWGLSYALRKTEPDPGKRKRKLGIFIAVVAAWLGFLTAGSLSGFFADFSGFPPKIAPVLILPLVTIAALTFSKGTGRLLEVIPPQWIAYLQSFRVVVEIGIWMLFAQQLMPEQMTFAGRNFDILVGATAPVIGIFVFAKRKWPRLVGILWNVGGLVLLANVVTIALFSMPTPFRVFMNEPSNTIVATFPFVLLPGILVPVAYSMHFFSLRQLIQEKSMEQRAVSKPQTSYL